jgi:hypothetical protein
MRLETIMWLLPVFFMIHDFEEIIMMRAWLERNAPELRLRFPTMGRRILPGMEKLSASAFALAVAEEFIILSVLTLISVELSLFALWAGILLAFFAHLIMHVIQWGVYKKYVPVIITCIPAGIYCIFALTSVSARVTLNWWQVLAWTLVCLVVAAANLFFAHGLAQRFQAWLDSH